MALGFEEFGGLDPRTGDDSVDRIARSRLEAIGKHHGGRKLHDFHSVVWLCESPRAAFEGIRHLDDTFCDPLLYRELPDPKAILLCGIPSERRYSEAITLPPPPGKTFCVVADPRLEIWNWFWFAGDKSKPDLPEGYQTRFDRPTTPAHNL